MLAASPPPASDVLWVTMRYADKLPVLHLLTVEMVDGQGHTLFYRGPGGLLDENRKASVNRYPLTGKIESYRGRTIYIRTMPGGRRLASIKFE